MIYVRSDVGAFFQGKPLDKKGWECLQTSTQLLPSSTAIVGRLFGTGTITVTFLFLGLVTFKSTAASLLGILYFVAIFCFWTAAKTAADLTSHIRYGFDYNSAHSPALTLKSLFLPKLNSPVPVTFQTILDEVPLSYLVNFVIIDVAVIRAILQQRVYFNDVNNDSGKFLWTE